MYEIIIKPKQDQYLDGLLLGLARQGLTTYLGFDTEVCFQVDKVIQPEAFESFIHIGIVDKAYVDAIVLALLHYEHSVSIIDNSIMVSIYEDNFREIKNG